MQKNMIKRFKGKTRRAFTILRQEGLYSLVFTHISGHIKEIKNPDKYEKGRVDNKKRWEMIEQFLDDEDKTALDIGCATGYFTNKFAENYGYAVGIDTRKTRIKEAKNKTKGKTTLEFKTKYLVEEITPKNIVKLPEADCIFFLTVYHHWTKFYGRERAEKMLKTLTEKTEKLFIELPGNIDKQIEKKEIGKEPENKNIAPKEYYENQLKRILDNQVDVEYIGKTDYKQREREDYIFCIEC
ncbi:class I SAM-dependent methyltransferase [Methanonatronarchaeum sp. AMET6-2]|uniref:class I SAM-dependent methyltransferase n=1 Tax=Methanonatronarchaeum sp. AMET6-2 TaxID=2933293 RepID=UPI001FF66DFF|nr:class I SAM-dependent methyltransferase [Methanonatronarchaeum sp. AMET6-2]UOY10325.1 class I SAM-dependent methyltransferase [Methanonatronarchaeum sp. AMET6-2]